MLRLAIRAPPAILRASAAVLSAAPHFLDIIKPQLTDIVVDTPSLCALAAVLSALPFPPHFLDIDEILQLTDIVVDAVLTIQKSDQPLDLHMVSRWLDC